MDVQALTRYWLEKVGKCFMGFSGASDDHGALTTFQLLEVINVSRIKLYNYNCLCYSILKTFEETQKRPRSPRPVPRYAPAHLVGVGREAGTVGPRFIKTARNFQGFAKILIKK